MHYTHGQPGSSIPGSKLRRWYCTDCGTPIRVLGTPADGIARCEECSGVKQALMPAPKAGPVDEDSNGGLANARRAMEEGT